MTHTVLARKWRPKRFVDLVGQKSTVTILQNIISSGRLHHAYLLTGTRGVGKTTIARIIAKALNCLSPSMNEPCGVCENCQQIDIGRFVDVIEIDAASNTGVDNIREVLENAQYAPTSGKYKIYIIDEVHMLSKSAFNAMLKTLEEPPAHVVFILATTDPQKVPITILSRCLQLKLRNLSSPEIKPHLMYVLQSEGYKFDDYAVELLSTAANGSMRDALSLTDQAIAFSNGNISLDIVQQMLGISDDKNIIAILTSIAKGDSNELVKICQQINGDGANLESILEQINSALFQIGLIQLSNQPDAKAELRNLAKSISLQDCQLYFEISNLGLEQIRKVNQKYPILTMTLLRMVAFTIGSSEQRQIIVAANNCLTDVSTQNLSTVSDVAIDTPEIIEHRNVDLSINVKNNDVVTLEVAIESHSPPPWEDNDIAELNVPAIEANIPDVAKHEDIDTSENLPALVDTKESKKFVSWLEFVRNVDLVSIPSNIGAVLNNASQVGEVSNDEIRLQINDSYRTLVDAVCVDFIEKLLFQEFNQHFDLSFDFNESVTSGTRKEFEQNQAQQNQLNAEEAIRNDPIVQDLVNNFSAKILSISPL